MSAHASSLVPDSLRWYVTVEIRPLLFQEKLSYRVSLPRIAGKPVTVRPVPATAEANAVVAANGGTLLHAPKSLQVRNALFVDDTEVTHGPIIRLDTVCDRSLRIDQPTGPPVSTQNQMPASDTLGLTIDYGHASVEEAQEAFARVREILPYAADGTPLVETPAHFLRGDDREPLQLRLRPGHCPDLRLESRR